eukprot:SAG31_NODE_12082_length_970_cov_1.313433_1_plen_148_part_10
MRSTRSEEALFSRLLGEVHVHLGPDFMRSTRADFDAAAAARALRAMVFRGFDGQWSEEFRSRVVTILREMAEVRENRGLVGNVPYTQRVQARLAPPRSNVQASSDATSLQSMLCGSSMDVETTDAVAECENMEQQSDGSEQEVQTAAK